MSCKELHEELVNMEEVECPFCNKQISKHTKKIEQCCTDPDIVNNNTIVCKNCGTVQGYTLLIEFIDFYENKHWFHRKSVYQRKYHLENIMNNIALKNGFQITVFHRNKIMRIFDEIAKIIEHVNIDRKRMININFILQKIFEMLDLPYEKIKTTKSKKTLENYDRYWREILSLSSDEIMKIIQE